MKIFCSLLGHTWLPETSAPAVHWNTTKDGHILVPTIEDKPVRHYEVCRRCGAKRATMTLRHDKDRPAPVDA